MAACDVAILHARYVVGRPVGYSRALSALCRLCGFRDESAVAERFKPLPQLRKPSAYQVEHGHFGASALTGQGRKRNAVEDVKLDRRSL